MEKIPDPLYLCVFNAVQDIWEEVKENAVEWRKDDPTAIPPKSFIVRECGNADSVRAYVAGPVLKDWTFDGTTFVEQYPLLGIDPDPLPIEYPRSILYPIRTEAEKAAIWITTSFFLQGIVCFHISSNRDHFVLTFQVGGRYGRGTIYNFS